MEIQIWNPSETSVEIILLLLLLSARVRSPDNDSHYYYYKRFFFFLKLLSLLGTRSVNTGGFFILFTDCDLSADGIFVVLFFFFFSKQYRTLPRHGSGRVGRFDVSLVRVPISRALGRFSQGALTEILYDYHAILQNENRGPFEISLIQIPRRPGLIADIRTARLAGRWASRGFRVNRTTWLGIILLAANYFFRANIKSICICLERVKNNDSCKKFSNTAYSSRGIA